MQLDKEDKMKIMLKLVVDGIIILVIGAMALGCNNKLLSEKGNGMDNFKSERPVNIQKGSLINFQLYKSYEVDMTEILTKEIPQFTWFEQVYDLNTWKNLGMFRDFTFPEFDFDDDDYQDKFLAVSFGREVVEMKVIQEAVSPSKSVEVAITFAEEYHNKTMFLYIMDKIYLRDGLGSEHYIMKGPEKVFFGKSVLELNKTTP